MDINDILVSRPARAEFQTAEKSGKDDGGGDGTTVICTRIPRTTFGNNTQRTANFYSPFTKSTIVIRDGSYKKTRATCHDDYALVFLSCTLTESVSNCVRVSENCTRSRLDSGCFGGKFSEIVDSRTRFIRRFE